MTRRKPKALSTVGWREWVLLPDLCPIPIKAKIDTGARTSSLHAFDMSLREVDGDHWVDFEIHPIQRSRAQPSQASYPVDTFRRVRSSTGHTEVRPVIRTPMRIGQDEYDIEVTLTSRDDMGFRMLLGRAAVRRRFRVDPGRSFLHAVAPTHDDQGEHQP